MGLAFTPQREQSFDPLGGVSKLYFILSSSFPRRLDWPLDLDICPSLWRLSFMEGTSFNLEDLGRPSEWKEG